MTNFDLVREFHEAFRVHPLASPTYEFKDLKELLGRRVSLLAEEFAETISADGIDQFLDGILDIMYICYGTLDLLGVDANAAFAEVHRSNMSKLGPDGEPIFDAKLKVVKGPNYSKPDLTKFIEQVMDGYTGTTELTSNKETK